VSQMPLMRRITLVVLLGNVILLAGGLWFIRKRLNEITEQVDKKFVSRDERYRFIQDRLESLRLGAFHDMVDRIAADATDDQERCIRLARHFAAHVRNNLRDEEGLGILESWSVRSGLCGTRAALLVKGLRRFGIVARIWNIYDYDFTHSCVQAHYAEGWHFFDPTYGGYFRGPDGQALSWQQIVEDPERALAGMVVFEHTLDRGHRPDGVARESRIDNPQRMRGVYRPDSLRRVRNAGFLKERVYTIPALFELPASPARLQLGQVDGQWEDMRSHAVRQLTQCNYLNSIGSASEHFAFAYRLKRLRGKTPVRLTVHLCRPCKGTERLTASSATGVIAQGAEGPVCGQIGTDSRQSWTIVYEPGDSAEHIIRVALSNYDAERSYCFVDAITIEQSP